MSLLARLAVTNLFTKHVSLFFFFFSLPPFLFDYFQLIKSQRYLALLIYLFLLLLLRFLSIKKKNPLDMLNVFNLDVDSTLAS